MREFVQPSWVIGLVLVGLLTGQASGDPPEDRPQSPALSFAQAREAGGLEFRRAREARLAAGPAGVEVARARAAAADATPNEKWLAEILIHRAANPAAFAAAEAEFGRMVHRAEYDGPRQTIMPIPSTGGLAAPRSRPDGSPYRSHCQ